MLYYSTMYIGYWEKCNPEEWDLTVAPELLSIYIPDTMVRRLAVQRLESLSIDDVLNYFPAAGTGMYCNNKGV